jgi:hypothetical protein
MKGAGTTFVFVMCRLTFLLAACGLSSCVPKGPSLGAGMPTLTEDGRYADTPYNRAYWVDTYRLLIEAELRHPDEREGWEATWRRTFEMIDQHIENPVWIRSTVRTMRRDASLPVWKFMY